MKKISVVSLIIFSANSFAAVAEAPQAQLIFYSPKKTALNYEIRKKSDKPESYTLTLSEERRPDKVAELSANDAKLILSEMTTAVWDYEYKSRPSKPDCAPFATLKAKENTTTVCNYEKQKAAKMLGLMSRLNYFLKATPKK